MHIKGVSTIYITFYQKLYTYTVKTSGKKVTNAEEDTVNVASD